MKSTAGPDCLITGGEPTVRLVPSENRGKGGRNQQLVLAALERLLKEGDSSVDGIVLLSGGTDGEDGPTDAAGAMLSAEVISEMRRQKLDPDGFLRRNDAYTFFEQTRGLIKTGPTNTNVCDLRVVTVSRT
jgi:hydroxypyruvate reductase